MGYLFLGTGGAIAAAVAVLAASGSLLVAFLTYVITGVTLTLTAAALSLICAPVRQRLHALAAVRRGADLRHH